VQHELIHGPRIFQQLESEWDQLAAGAMTSTPFQSRAYQQAWWNHLGPGELFTIVLRNGDASLCAIACFYLLDGLLYFNGCVEETDYLDLITAAPDAPHAWSAVLELLENSQLPPWRGLNLCNIPQDSPSRTILQQLAQERSLAFSTEVQEVCPIIELPQSFEEYLMQLDKKQRHEIRRKKRRADAAGTELKVVTAEDDVTAEVDDFLDLLQMSASEKEDWLNEERRAVFHEVAKSALDAGTLQLLFLQQGDQKIAGLYNFDYKDRIWVYNSGFNVVEFGHLSPGVVLTGGAIELAIGAGRREFDFLRGDEQYKYRFGAKDTTVHRIQITRA
jgi:CelD/BcsL family acetyltransferase involved in cellulose biosynthesis